MVSELIFFLGEFLCVLLPNLCLAIYYWKWKKSPLHLSMMGLWLMWLIYFASVFYFTSAGTLDSFWQNYGRINWGQVNLVLFARRLSPTVIRQNVLNICLFIPLGLLMSTMVKNKRALVATFSLGFYFSLLIELSQLFNHRRSDVDDLLFNTLGAVIGWLIGVILYYLYCLLTGKREQKIAFPWLLVSMLSFAGHFLFFKPLFWSSF